ncbi:MAG: hypothetical protein ACLUD2_07580 [Clostridium sp.]
MLVLAACARNERRGSTRHFAGMFDGCGNTITGLKIAGELDGKTNLGLFGVIGGGMRRKIWRFSVTRCGGWIKSEFWQEL